MSRCPSLFVEPPEAPADALSKEGAALRRHVANWQDSLEALQVSESCYLLRGGVTGGLDRRNISCSQEGGPDLEEA